MLLSDPFAVLKPQLAPSSRLWPPSVIGPAQLPPEELLATIVLAIVAAQAVLPQALPIAPPLSLALLSKKVLFRTVVLQPHLKSRVDHAGGEWCTAASSAA